MVEPPWIGIIDNYTIQSRQVKMGILPKKKRDNLYFLRQMPIYEVHVFEGADMELSAIAKEYNVPLTRPESDLLAQLGTGTSSRSQDRYERQMKDLAAARAVVKQLPDKKTMERQNKQAKADMLKQRLKMLRQMLPFLSPSALKSLKVEMKQIAAQVASLEDGSGGGTGGSAMATTEATTADAPQSDNEAKTSPGAVQSSETDGGDGGYQQKQSVLSDRPLQEHALKGSTSITEARQLNETVEEVKNLYKTVIAALKRKQQAGHGSGQHAEPDLRVYAVVPDNTSRVAIKV